MSDLPAIDNSKPVPRRSRLFLGVLLVLLVGVGGTALVLYKKIWDADRPSDPLPGRATGLTKPDLTDPVAPAPTESKSLETIVDFFNGLKTALAYARDSMRSRFAIETVKSLAGQVDGLKELIDKLPAMEKAKAAALVRDQLALVRMEAETSLATRGVGSQLKPIVEPMLAKLEALGK
ncbi:MAG: hypothetical protein JNK93_15985 [Planctomycetia bacterium]|nr:hypothetical protein [Planctomycetia bacterium]